MSPTENPVHDLHEDYNRRREALNRSTVGHAGARETRRVILGAADGMLARALKTRETLLATEVDLKAGRISGDMAPKIRRAALEDARAQVERSAGATRKVLEVLPDRLLGEAWPLHVERSPKSTEAKADLALALGGLKGPDLAAAFPREVERRASEGDALAVDILMSGHGRDLLRAGGVEDADGMHRGVRQTYARTLPLNGDRAEALKALDAAADWNAALTVAHHVASMTLDDLEAGRLDA